MTRHLSQLLGASEPMFGQSIELLEQASGRPSADIRLTSELMQRARLKITQLGLDPHDTTGPELYRALHERLRQDEVKVRSALNIASDAPANEVLSRVQQFLQGHEMPKNCFALKASVAKRLLKKRPPKTAMKRLGYRSADSMLKHEPVAQIYAAALIFESATWHKAYLEQYNKLQCTDFESRTITLLAPQSVRWHEAAANFVGTARHNILCFKDLGAVVMLPIDQAVDGLAITTLLLTLTYYNDVRTYSSYAKLQQVKPDFGSIIRQTVGTEPLTSARLAGQPVPWRMVQQYYGNFAPHQHPEVFEPHVQPEDLAWHHAEDTLASIEPSLAFWQDTQGLSVLHEGQPVSCNALDVALSFVNNLPFADRIVHFVRDNLWQELMMRYLNQKNLETAVNQQLAGELIDNGALAE